MRAAQRTMCLFSRNSANRASALASAAVDAAVCINLVLAAVLSDCAYRAGPSAGTATQASVLINLVCHCQYTSLQIYTQR